MQKYYVIDIEWSASDIDTVIVKAATAEEALKRIKDRCNARFISIVRTAESVIEL